MKPLAILLAISVALNLWFGRAYLDQRDKATEALVEERQTTGVALECSKGTEDLSKQAGQRMAAAAPKIKAAQQQADAGDRRADVILTTPASTPGNDCRSAEARVDDWWEKRGKP